MISGKWTAWTLLLVQLDLQAFFCSIDILDACMFNACMLYRFLYIRDQEHPISTTCVNSVDSCTTYNLNVMEYYSRKWDKMEGDDSALSEWVKAIRHLVLFF